MKLEAARYELEALVGVGGTASVYRARHRELGSVHAVKVVPGGGAELARRLDREGRSQAALRHPNTVPVTDVVRVDGAPALVMPYVPGPTLAAWLDDHRPELAQVDWLVNGVARGVRAAHDAGLVHRDLKPANILLDPTAEGPIPRVADFGLCRALAGDSLGTRPGQVLGTPCYMAPEQFVDAGGVGPEADVFSLGALAWELLTGRRAFAAGDVYETIALIGRGEYPPLIELVPYAPERMVAAIEGALEPDPARRLADCGAFLAVWNGGQPYRGAWVGEVPCMGPVEALPVEQPGRSGPPRSLWLGAALCVGVGVAWVMRPVAEVAPPEPEPVEVRAVPVPVPVPVPPEVPRAIEVPPPMPAPVARPAPVEEQPPLGATLWVNSAPFPLQISVAGVPVQRKVRTPVAAGRTELAIEASDGRVHTATVEVGAGQDARYCWDFDRAQRCD